MACILVELKTRQPLFRGLNHIDQVKQIMSIVGTPDEELMQKITSSSVGHFCFVSTFVFCFGLVFFFLSSIGTGIHWETQLYQQERSQRCIYVGFAYLWVADFSLWLSWQRWIDVLLPSFFCPLILRGTHPSTSFNWFLLTACVIDFYKCLCRDCIIQVYFIYLKPLVFLLDYYKLGFQSYFFLSEVVVLTLIFCAFWSMLLTTGCLHAQ